MTPGLTGHVDRCLSLCLVPDRLETCPIVPLMDSTLISNKEKNSRWILFYNRTKNLFFSVQKNSPIAEYNLFSYVLMLVSPLLRDMTEYMSPAVLIFQVPKWGRVSLCACVGQRGGGSERVNKNTKYSPLRFFFNKFIFWLNKSSTLSTFTF